MHDAFECVSILERLPLQIECIAASGQTLLVGTNKGQLLVYGILNISGGPTQLDVELRRSIKNFAKRSIVQVSIVKELGIIVSLSDSVVNVHDAENYTLKSQLSKTKGATFFALDVKIKASSSGVAHDVSARLCVVVKRRLQMFHWKDKEFQELYPDLAVVDTPKSVAWADDYICVAQRKDYYLMKADGGDIVDLFSTGKQMEPSISQLSTGELALSIDTMSVVLTIDKEGLAAKKHSVTWSDMPSAVYLNDPYILALLPESVEVRSRSPKVMVQKIRFPKVKAVISDPVCYVCSSTHVWRLVRIPFSRQIAQLVAEKQYEMALKLATHLGDDEESKAKQNEIKLLYAFDLFCGKKFKEAIKLYQELDVGPVYVIGLFPNLLPEQYRREQLTYPGTPPTLTDGDLEKGFSELSEYLTMIRNSHVREQSTVEEESVDNVEKRKMLMQIIDTSLLKCYLQTNDALIKPLLRLEDNYCHVEECERVLIKAKKFNELVLLYQSRGVHKKALDLLLRQADKPSSPLHGHHKLVEYLQKLGPNNINLILEYSPWVLQNFPADGLTIFTNDTHLVESLPRDKVLAHLDKHGRHLVLEYLDFIITDWNEDKPEFHNRLVEEYKDKIYPLFKEYVMSLPEGEPKRRAGDELGELGELRKKLIFFLQTSSHYQPMKLVRKFPTDCLFEERAILFGKAGRHEDALSTYIYVLKDKKLAEQYCRMQYELDREKNKDVYISLLKMYLKLNEFEILSIANPEIKKEGIKMDIPAAIQVMNEHAEKIDVAQALDLLPPSIEVKKVFQFLNVVLEDKMRKRRYNQVLRSLLYAEHLQVYEQKIFYQSGKCSVTDERACSVCHKRIGTSAFARYPNGVIVHYYCCQDRQKLPVEADS